MPPLGAEQHPLLQGWFVPQTDVQVLVVRSQALPVGQSPAVRQPHLLAPVPATATHPLPVGFPTQEVQAGWPVLQAAPVVPALQVLLPGAQHPPLHAVC